MGVRSKASAIDAHLKRFSFAPLQLAAVCEKQHQGRGDVVEARVRRDSETTGL